MKKFVLLFIYVFLMLPVFAQTNFQELSLEKALEKAKGEGAILFCAVSEFGRGGVDP